jgi:hypothetical protein
MGCTHLLADDADERELVALDIAAALAGASRRIHVR